MAVTGAMQVIVVGVLGQPPVEESPGQVVYSVLLVLYGTSYNLCKVTKAGRNKNGGLVNKFNSVCFGSFR